MNNSTEHTNNTEQVDKVVVSEQYSRKLKKGILEQRILNAYQDTVTQLKRQAWIPFIKDGQKGWYNQPTRLAIPVLANYNTYNDTMWGLNNCTLNTSTASVIFNNHCPQEIVQAVQSSQAKLSGNGNTFHIIVTNDGLFIFESKVCHKPQPYSMELFSKLGYTLKVSAVRISSIVFFEKYFEFIDNSVLQKARVILGNGNKELSEAEIKELCALLQVDTNVDLSQEQTQCKIDSDSLATELVCADLKRAGLEKYDRKWLDDINQGLWELWQCKGEQSTSTSAVAATISKPLVARNPACDIHRSGLIGIDFGTKSTIVSKQDGKKSTTLVRVGLGQLNKAAQLHHYENPTIMEFLNVDKFLAAYNAQEGRPQTSIDDLRVSHPAEKDLESCENSDLFYSFFYDIKQWCGDTDRLEKIIDQQGKEKILPSFVALKPGEFNPLEIYAYYLGLYINNMFNGIFLDYVLSFPVTYEKAVKDKIVESFRIGLRKSLPESIVRDEKIMSGFRVRQGVSEPAAYAITALKNYNFEPEDDEQVMYGIFDFGGGTTDFDFGIWRVADESKRDESSYDYVIEHFGSEGDKYLGGENLLELLAFEIFKANAKILQAGKSKKDGTASVGFSFSKPKECSEFPGSETLIANTQEARRNTKQLMEVLRPFWEGIIAEADNSAKSTKGQASSVPGNTKEYNGYIFRNDEDIKFPIADDGTVSVDLFDKEGKLQSGFKLAITKKSEIDVDLIKILTDRIEKGVTSFFKSVLLAFSHPQVTKNNITKINIFLAGNSSKSPILRKLFNKYIEQQNKEIAKSVNKVEANNANLQCFELFPPLGTEEAAEIQKKRGAKACTDIVAPTGKTGVAYGLIEGRDSGRIKVISEISANDETKFKYSLGIEKRGKFRIKERLDRNDIEYGVWRYFAPADKELEFYYTSSPCANLIPIDDPSLHLIHVQSQIDADSDIYVRAVSPTDIEYIFVPQDTEPKADANGIRIHLSE